MDQDARESIVEIGRRDVHPVKLRFASDPLRRRVVTWPKTTATSRVKKAARNFFPTAADTIALPPRNPWFLSDSGLVGLDRWTRHSNRRRNRIVRPPPSPPLAHRSFRSEN